jgi:hypothetical protein
MGYREDITLSLTEDGWDALMTNLGSTILSDEVRQEVTDLINAADAHHVNSANAHLLFFECIKSTCDDWQHLLNLLNMVNMDEWHYFSMGEDGAEDWGGNWCDNPFNPYVSRQLCYDTSGCTQLSGKVVTINVRAPSNMKVETPVDKPVVNDYTCGCGNDRCSRTEKSCWRCGAPIE